MLFTYLHEIGGGTGELSLRFAVLLLPVFFLYFTVISVYYRDNRGFHPCFLLDDIHRSYLQLKLPLMIVAFGSFVLDGLGLLSAKYFYVVAFVDGLFIYGYLFYCLMYIQDEYRRSTS